jgi:hypothetical protein
VSLASARVACGGGNGSYVDTGNPSHEEVSSDALLTIDVRCRRTRAFTLLSASTFLDPRSSVPVYLT